MLNKILELLKVSNVFLTGGGGVGKSHITREIISYYAKNDKTVVVLGSTGISAVGVGGVSCHSFFRFGLCSNFEELSVLDKKQRRKLETLKLILKKCDLIVIDEISMISGELMEMIRFRLIWGKFSGKLLLVGDFYQLPPVAKNLEDKLFSLKYAFNSFAWQNFNLKNVELVVSKRTTDIEFYKILSQLRLGVINKNIIDFLKNRMTGEIQKDYTVLFGRNLEANKLNMVRLNEIDSPLEKILAQIDIYDKFLNEMALNKWINNINSPTELNLKIGAKVMFCINKWGNFYNGEQGIIIDFKKIDGEIDCIIVQKNNGVCVEVERFIYELFEFEFIGDNVEQKTKATFKQFPLKLAYAVTIHKSQGMSIEKLTCNLDNIFINGQLYVALSRAINANTLYINFTKNINFELYLKQVVNIDEEIDEFYKNGEFLKEEI